MQHPDKIVVPAIFILLLLSAHAVSDTQVCVDCDLDKNIKIINTKVVEDKILYNDVRKVKNDTEQYCFVKITIKEKDGVVSKEEELYCSDGRKGIDTPSYWELFAQFYYRDVVTPEYCRYYSRKNHAFKSFGKVCLNENGEWKVK
jgi:hypothetical protein